MKDYSLFKFILLLLFIDKISNLQSESLLQTTLQNSKVSLDDIIEYLAETEENKNKNENQISEVNLLEKKAETSERGKGCESMNLCSGKGTCSSGACVCDEGFDYFDCSVNTSSSYYKIKYYNKFDSVKFFLY